jgi:ribonuclease VapC
MIVDSSALIAILRAEPEQAEFRAALEAQRDNYISAGTLIEARIMAISLNILKELNDLISELGIRIVPVDVHQSSLATGGFAKYGKGRHPAALNFGDLFAYALAKTLDEPLLFKGNDFAKTDVGRVV